jgi:hypothetical protein
MMTRSFSRYETNSDEAKIYHWRDVRKENSQVLHPVSCCAIMIILESEPRAIRLSLNADILPDLVLTFLADFPSIRQSSNDGSAMRHGPSSLDSHTVGVSWNNPDPSTDATYTRSRKTAALSREWPSCACCKLTTFPSSLIGMMTSHYRLFATLV